MQNVQVVMVYEGLIAADMQARGWEPKLYQITGPRGGVKMAWRSLATGEFSKL